MRIAKYFLSALAGGPLVFGFVIAAAAAGMEPQPTETVVTPSVIVPAPAMRSILPPPPMPKA
jgi:hypothetical protein